MWWLLILSLTIRKPVAPMIVNQPNQPALTISAWSQKICKKTNRTRQLKTNQTMQLSRTFL